MHKSVIITEDNRIINLEYDIDEYNIEYIKHKNVVVLKRLSDNIVIDIFSDKIGFVVQNNSNNKINFIVSDYSSVGNKIDDKAKLKHYVDHICIDKLDLISQFDYDGSKIGQCRITENTFVVEQKGYGGCLYNIATGSISEKFDYIYDDKEINKLLGENILMVSMKKGTLHNSEINDNITYGINPETFEIVTPIWSELQQRHINIYTKEQIDKIDMENPFFKVKELSLGQTTIFFEVDKYLQLLSPYFTRSDEMYVGPNEKLNSEFIKSFIKK